MKRNDWLLIISILCYSWLFYNQFAGLNFLLFNIAMLACLAIRDISLLKRPTWLITSAGCLISSFSVAWHGNALSVVANVISLSVLSGLSYNTSSSVLLSLLFSAYSYITSPVFMIVDWTERRARAVAEQTGKRRKLILIFAPIIITLVFFFIYRSSNALFDALASKINFDFISWNWVLFTTFGAILLYGFFYYRRIDSMKALDDNTSLNLSPLGVKPFKFLNQEVSISDENFSGILLFVLLNLLLLIVNALDINFMFGDQTLPLGVSYKQFVHQGIDMLIVSIIVAISIILFFFRGGLNFYQKNTPIKALACLWVAQNAFMVCSTVWRNHLYVHEYGLTYKRIGVYVYLLLTLIGLATTLIKVLRVKSNIYLFRRNSWIFYCLLIILSLPNWEMLVTGYNVGRIKKPDINYLLTISNSNLPEILPAFNEDFQSNQDSAVSKEYLSATYCYKLYNALVSHDTIDWRSRYYDESVMHDKLTSKEFTDKMTMLDLSQIRITNDVAKVFSIYNHVTNLRACNKELYSLNVLSCFQQLEKLDISNSGITDYSGIENFKNLQYLDIRYDYVGNFEPIYKLKNLRELHIGGFMTEDQTSALHANLPDTKIIMNTPF